MSAERCSGAPKLTRTERGIGSELPLGITRVGAFEQRRDHRGSGELGDQPADAGAERADLAGAAARALGVDQHAVALAQRALHVAQRVAPPRRLALDGDGVEEDAGGALARPAREE